jgi:hypothetical protein
MKDSSLISLRVSNIEKRKIKLLAQLEKKTVTQLFKDLVSKELNLKKLTAKEIRELPRDLRKEVLMKMTDEAMLVYNKYKDELFIDETGDGIE